MPLSTDTEARLEEIAQSTARLASHVHTALGRLLAGEMPLEAAELPTRQAETLLALWQLEADLLRRVQARKQQSLATKRSSDVLETGGRRMCTGHAPAVYTDSGAPSG